MNKETEYYENLNKAIKQMPVIAKQVNKAIENILKEIPKVIERLETNIKTMDSDKFEECINKLDDTRLREKAIAIRNGEKVSWF